MPVKMKKKCLSAMGWPISNQLAGILISNFHFTRKLWSRLRGVLLISTSMLKPKLLTVSCVWGWELETVVCKIRITKFLIHYEMIFKEFLLTTPQTANLSLSQITTVMYVACTVASLQMLTRTFDMWNNTFYMYLFHWHYGSIGEKNAK